MTPGFGSTRSQALLLIHSCVVLWGFTAILGRLITLPAVPLVAWRLALVLLVLILLPRFWRGWRAMPGPVRRRAALAGVFVALHWWTFYAAIKLANASVAVACIAVAPVFLSLVEPAITRRAFRRRELVLGLLAVPGVWMVIGGTPSAMNMGIVVGISSAAFVAVFSTLNKTLASVADPYTLTGVEFAVGLLLLLFIMLLQPPAAVWPSATDGLWLVILALACTLLPFIMAFVALRVLSAWETHLVVNLEPVYAMILAALLLNEGAELQPLFYLGVGLLVATTAVATRRPRTRPARSGS